MKADRSAIREKLQEIKASRTRSAKLAHIPGLHEAALSTQKAFRNELDALGIEAVRSFWVDNCCIIKATEQQVERLRALPMVLGIWKDESTGRGPNSIPVRHHDPSPMPMIGRTLPWDMATDPDNHRIFAAQEVPPADPQLPLENRGTGITIGFLDTGVDKEGGALGPSVPPHPAFNVPNASTTPPATTGFTLPVGTRLGTRLWDSVFVNELFLVQNPPPIDCNSPGLHNPYTTAGNLSARHGTGKAGIAAGLELAALGSAGGFSHAPEALVMSWSVSHGVQGPGPVWTTFTSTFILAIEKAEEWVLMGQGHSLDVLNISYDGWSSPGHPTNIALDKLANDYNVLIVNAAGNFGDTTSTSIGAYNGLSVGNVYGRTGQSAQEASYVPNHTSARGPLFGYSDRFYPDLCAVGSKVVLASQVNPAESTGVRQPLVDDINNTSSYDVIGTSESAAQVSGAAALYLSRRKARSMPASFLEAKAAILVTVDDVYAKLVNADPPENQHIYLNRNAYGVGFLRDDRLAEFAERGGPGDLQHGEEVVLSANSPNKTIMLSGFGPSQLVAVAITWPRVFLPDEEGGDGLPVLIKAEAEVKSGGVVFARSFPSGNSYRYLVFKTPATHSGPIDIVVKGFDIPTSEQAPGLTVPVYVAVRPLDSFDDPVNAYTGTGTVETIPQVAACNPGLGSVGQEVTRTLPIAFTGNYGGGPLFGPGTVSPFAKNYAGFRFTTSQTGTFYRKRVIAYKPNAVYTQAEIDNPPLPEIMIKEISFRFVPPDSSNGAIPTPYSPSGTWVKLGVSVGNSQSGFRVRSVAVDQFIQLPQHLLWNLLSAQ